MQRELLEILYNTRLGRICLKALINPRVSEIAGMFLDTCFSKIIIRPFIRYNNINISECEREKIRDYESFNDFFTRELKENARRFEMEPSVLASPCDSRLSVYKISGDAVFNIKDTSYTMDELVKNKALAKRYEGGFLCVFRLSVDDYHYFSYVDDGRRSKNYRIPGVFHTVAPAATENIPVYKENTREFSLLKSDNFGTILMMEVGAMLVGRINNFHEEKNVSRGETKGCFEFGGSTVILAFERDKVQFFEEILENSAKGIETRVLMGEAVGWAGI